MPHNLVLILCSACYTATIELFRFSDGLKKETWRYLLTLPYNLLCSKKKCLHSVKWLQLNEILLNASD
jgi:hypothetical protein